MTSSKKSIQPASPSEQPKPAMLPQDSITVLNTPCLLTTRESLTDTISSLCQNRDRSQPVSVDFTNVHIVAMRTTDSTFHANTSSVDWFVSDSQILSWSLSLLGGRNHSRVYGPDFLAYFFNSSEKNLKHAFLGGSQECLDKLCKNLKNLRPDVQIAAARNGYFKPVDETGIIEHINQANADILWVGLGTPKQQQWIHQHKSKLNVAAILAVGFAFDVNAGTKPDAPSWLGPLGLTWLYRLIKEPRRLWKRYLFYNTIFIYRLTSQILFSAGKNHPAK